jgi:hypothetical protein
VLAVFVVTHGVDPLIMLPLSARFCNKLAGVPICPTRANFTAQPMLARSAPNAGPAKLTLPMSPEMVVHVGNVGPRNHHC